MAREARRGAAERDAGFVIVACGVKWTPALALAPNMVIAHIVVASVVMALIVMAYTVMAYSYGIFLGPPFGWNQALQKRKPVALFTHGSVNTSTFLILLRLWHAKRDVGFVIGFVVRNGFRFGVFCRVCGA